MVTNARVDKTTGAILPDAPLSKAALKNKKKREAAKKKVDDDDASPASPVIATTIKDASKSQADAPKTPLTEREKKIKAIQKKLKQISDLKQKQVSGEPLELTQVAI